MPEKNSTSPGVSAIGPGGSELGRASYRAQQVPGAVVIFAEGWHPTSGYVDFFEQSPLDIYPPEFIFRTIPPKGMVTQVLTPFVVWVMFGASEPVKKVTVTDADGRHEIKVEQTPDIAVAKPRDTWVYGSVVSGGGSTEGFVTAEATLAGATTMATGEEGITAPTTMATGEEGTGGPTTMATGEEASAATTLAVGEEHPNFATTLAVGEESPGFTTLAIGEEGATTDAIGEEGPTTFRVGEEGPTTEAIGEEGPTTFKVGEEGPTTLRFGEEGPTTFRVGEEGATTDAIGEEGSFTTLAVGEEGPTTLAVGEESGGGGFPGGNPFGGF